MCWAVMPAESGPAAPPSPVQDSYPAHLAQLCQHHHDGGVVLPEHPPEILRGLGQRSLRGDVGLLLPAANETELRPAPTSWGAGGAGGSAPCCSRQVSRASPRHCGRDEAAQHVASESSPHTWWAPPGTGCRQAASPSWLSVPVPAPPCCSSPVLLHRALLGTQACPGGWKHSLCLATVPAAPPARFLPAAPTSPPTARAGTEQPNQVTLSTCTTSQPGR